MYIPVVRCLTPNDSSSCVDGIIYHQVLYVLHRLVSWGVSNFGSRLIKSRENRTFLVWYWVRPLALIPQTGLIVTSLPDNAIISYPDLSQWSANKWDLGRENCALASKKVWASSKIQKERSKEFLKKSNIVKELVGFLGRKKISKQVLKWHLRQAKDLTRLIINHLLSNLTIIRNPAGAFL